MLTSALFLLAECIWVSALKTTTAKQEVLAQRLLFGFFLLGASGHHFLMLASSYDVTG